MKIDSYIEYLEVNYLCVEVTIFEGTDNEETIKVSSESLNNDFMDAINAGNYAQMYVDDEVASYLSEEELNSLSYEEIVVIVEENYK